MKLESDKQFVATDSAVKAILEHYGFDLISYKAASSGIENTTLLIIAKPNNIVIRIYRLNKKPIAEMELEINFMEYLYKNGIKVPNIIHNKHNLPITEFHWDDNIWQVVALEYISGEHAKEYSPELIADIASWQAKMHNASANYPVPADAPKLDDTLVESYFLPSIDVSKIDNVNIKQFLERAKDYKLVLNNTLPTGLCHLDYDKDNIISYQNKVKAILDFDDLALAPFIVCLGYTIWHIWRYAGKDMADLYLSDYESIRPLNALEKQAMAPIVLYRHYMISDLKIMYGHTSDIDADEYIKFENEIIKSINS